MTTPEDLNVDDLKRRARRRLVGAIVLALAVAVFVPMLLESEPKPLGEDVTVRIPPVDDGKFVSRLNEKAKPESAKGDSRGDAGRGAAMNAEKAKADKAAAEMAKLETPRAEPLPQAASTSAATKVDAPTVENAKVPATKSDAAGGSAAPDSTPRRSLADAEQKVLAAPSKAPAPATAPQSTAATAPQRAAATPASTAPAPPTVAPLTTTASAPQAAPRAEANATPAQPTPGFSVQLGAFSDDKGANALSNKLKRAGYPAYVEPLATSKGTWWRVRVGPYPSRDAAATSRDKLKGDGYSGIVAAAK